MFTQNGMRLAVCAFAVLVGASMAAGAEDAAADADKDWTAELTFDYYSKYIWRGINLTDDPVLQPSLTLGWKGFSVNLWGNLELTDVNDENDRFTEYDYTIDYSGSWGKVNYSVGLIRYHFPHTDVAGTTELYAGLGLDVPLSPTLTVFKDVDEIHGTYTQFAVSHTFENVLQFSETLTANLDLGASVSYSDHDFNRGYTGTNGSGLHDLTLSAGLPFAIGEHWTVTPSVNWSQLLDHEIRDAVSDDDNFWAGVSVGFSF